MIHYLFVYVGVGGILVFRHTKFDSKRNKPNFSAQAQPLIDVIIMKLPVAPPQPNIRRPHQL